MPLFRESLSEVVDESVAVEKIKEVEKTLVEHLGNSSRCTLWNDGKPLVLPRTEQELFEEKKARLQDYVDHGYIEAARSIVECVREELGLPILKDDYFDPLSDECGHVLARRALIKEQEYAQTLPFRISDEEKDELGALLIAAGVITPDSDLNTMKILIHRTCVADHSEFTVKMVGTFTMKPNVYPVSTACATTLDHLTRTFNYDYERRGDWKVWRDSGINIHELELLYFLPQIEDITFTAGMSSDEVNAAAQELHLLNVVIERMKAYMDDRFESNSFLQADMQIMDFIARKLRSL